MIQELYTNLNTYIQAEVPAIQHIALWNNQIKRINQESVFAFPALFIAFPTVQYLDYPNGQQLADINVEFYLCTNTLDAESLEMFTVADTLHKALQNYSATNTGPFSRHSLNTDTDHENIYTLIINYTCTAVDTSAVPEISIISSPELQLNPNLGIDDDIIRTGIEE